MYLLEISNEGIKTDVQEVVQEGIDKCFSILIWLGLHSLNQRLEQPALVALPEL